MDREEVKELVSFLGEYVTDHKKELIQRVLEHRTKNITVVLEDIYQSQNASAVIRSMDCFGIQDLHVIENRNSYRVNPLVTHGSSKWVSIHQYNQDQDNTTTCLQQLKGEGYTLVATTPHAEAVSIYDWELPEKTAIMFGTELTGLSDTAMDFAEAKVRIPMLGFTESFNISVSAALTMQILREKLEKSNYTYHLSEEEKYQLSLDWYSNIVKRSDMIIESYKAQRK